VIISGQEYLVPYDSPSPDAYETREGQTLMVGRGGTADVRFAGHDASLDLEPEHVQVDERSPSSPACSSS
jgi:hypothetical protein